MAVLALHNLAVHRLLPAPADAAASLLAAAGWVFAGLRLCSGSLVAPVLAHAATNATAYAAGRRLARAGRG